MRFQLQIRSLVRSSPCSQTKLSLPLRLKRTMQDRRPQLSLHTNPSKTKKCRRNRYKMHLPVIHCSNLSFRCLQQKFQELKPPMLLKSLRWVKKKTKFLLVPNLPKFQSKQIQCLARLVQGKLAQLISCLEIYSSKSATQRKRVR